MVSPMQTLGHRRPTSPTGWPREVIGFVSTSDLLDLLPRVSRRVQPDRGSSRAVGSVIPQRVDPCNRGNLLSPGTGFPEKLKHQCLLGLRGGLLIGSKKNDPMARQHQVGANAHDIPSSVTRTSARAETAGRTCSYCGSAALLLLHYLRTARTARSRESGPQPG